MNDLQVPWLRAGVGRTPADGGCLLQVIDWIDRAQWTDKPECVHPVIREVAIFVNDKMGDDERQKLLDLAPRITGTNTGDDALTRQLMGWLARQVYPIWERWATENNYDDSGSVLACIEAAEQGKAAWAAEAAWAAQAAWAAEAAEAARAAEAAWAAQAAWAAEAAAPFDLLVGLLDEYDRLTGRSTYSPISAQDLEAVACLMK